MAMTQSVPSFALAPERYTIGIITILQTESIAASAILDERHARPDIDNDIYRYKAGKIGDHCVIIARTGEAGPSVARDCAAHMKRSFRNIKFAFLTGVAGGVPSDRHDIRLGDVVVSRHDHEHGGVVAYVGTSLGKEGPQRATHMNRPPKELLNVVDELAEQIELENDPMQSFMSQMPRGYTSAEGLIDILYKTDDGEEQVVRDPRPQAKVHYGLVASGPWVIKTSGDRRAELLKVVNNADVLCFEMEAEGVMNSQLDCLVVRGISDYCDAHKNKDWQRYASATAACYVKWVLREWKPTGWKAGSAQGKYRLPFQFSTTLPVPKFVGREEQMSELDSWFFPSEPSQQQKIYILSGMGGVGKTQLSLHFARRHKENYTACAFFDGASIGAVKQSFRQLAARLPTTYQPLDEMEEKDDDEVAIERVLGWLSLDDNRHWLLVFDNVDLDCDSNPPDEQAYDVQNFIPRVDHGSVIITTRLRSLDDLGFGRNLGGLDSTASRKLLEAKVGRSLEGNVDADQTIKLLEGLPLALTLASAFIHRTACSFASYNRQYVEEWEDLAKRQDRYKVREYRGRQMLTTWSMSLRQVQNTSETAASLFKLWAFLNRANLNYKLFRPVAYEKSGKFEWPAWLKELAHSQGKFLDAMQHLLQFSLVSAFNEEMYSMHPLIHEWNFSAINLEAADRVQACVCYAINLIGCQLVHEEPFLNESSGTRALASHAMQISRRAFQNFPLTLIRDVSDVTTLKHAYYLAALLFDCNELEEAEKMYTAIHRQRKQFLGRKHPLTLHMVECLGEVYQRQGKHNDAETLFKRALRRLERFHGIDHSTTFLTVNNLACLYAEQGRSDEAETLFKRALQGREKTFGPKDSSTLTSLYDLGTLYLTQGKLDEAEEMLQRALQGAEKKFGRGDTRTLQSVETLACLYSGQDKLNDAERMYEWAEQEIQKAGGLERNSTLLMFYDIGNLYSRLNRLDKAGEMYERVLKEKEEEDTHDDEGRDMTCDTANRLARVYSEQGRPNEAEKTLRRVLEGREKLGLSPTSTVDIIHGLAALYYERGKYDEAEELLRSGLKELGSDHELTLKAVTLLGCIYRSQGQLDKEEQMFEWAVQGYQRLHGNDHMLTLRSLCGLGDVYARRGKLEEAEKVHKQALQTYEQTLGKDHPSTQGCLDILKRVQQAKQRDERGPQDDGMAH